MDHVYRSSHAVIYYKNKGIIQWLRDAVFMVAFVALTLSTSTVFAYSNFSAVDSLSHGSCANCHGAMPHGSYWSRTKDDPVMWEGDPGTGSIVPFTLMGGHYENNGADCNDCHNVFGSTSPPMPTVACSMCHGRSEDGPHFEDGVLPNPPVMASAGLRQHHFRAGIRVCEECHLDANPGYYTPVGENVPSPRFLQKGLDPCAEALTGIGFGSRGLDQDGDMLRDQDDPDCGTYAACGDGFKNITEACDDGNNDDGDGCSSTCQIEAYQGCSYFCGDGTVDIGEYCDDGNNYNGDGCDSSCINEVCGNGILQVGEQCDDGNTIDGDGCTSICTREFCGDGIVNNGEACDDGNQVNGDGCENNCTLTP